MRPLSSKKLARARAFRSSLMTALGISTTLLIAGCGGGGCSTGCGGSSVIPGGFPKASRVTNAAGVRVTRAGLDFIQANLGTVITNVLSGGGGTVKDGVLTFEIPQSDGTVKNPIPFLPDISYTICVGGPKPTEDPPKCVVEINVKGIKDVKLKSQGPHDLIIDAVIPIRLRNLPLKVAGISTTAGLGVGSSSDCGTLTYVDVPVTADVSLENIPDDATHTARAGYTKINIAKMTFDQTPVKDNFKFCGGGIGTAILNLIKPLIVGFISGGLGDKLTGPLANATCMKAQKLDDGTLQCPTGTFNRSGTCRYADDDAGECVPMLLGLESRFDLSGLLASLSPGTSGGLDFMLASGGDMNPAPGSDPNTNGITLNMLGGALPHPISNCVPQVDNPPPTGILIPDELQTNTITPWAEPTPPHLGIGLAERYLNHAATGAYNSGLFCIGVSSEQITQLDAGLFKLLLPSIDQISEGFSAGDSHPSMGLSIRPQKPPVITVGDNTDDFSSPLLGLALKDTDLDFYMWSENRFIRLFTGRIDITVPINLDSTPAGLQIKLPAKNPITFANPRISNNGILLEDDAKVGKLVQSIGGLIPTTALSSIKPFNLDSSLKSLGLKLVIPKDGIRKLTKGDERFLAIYATLDVATSGMPTTRTSAKITGMTLDPSSYLKLETFGDHPAEITMHAESDLDDGSRAIEYSYKVDGGSWTPFTKGRDFPLFSPYLVLEGRHTAQVTSRIEGLPETEGEAVTVPFVIDLRAPVVRVQSASPGVVKILASDLVTPSESLKVEMRLDEGMWTLVPGVEGKGAIERFVTVPEGATHVDVRATDESGNVGQSTSALLRGRADPTVAGKAGCGCSVPRNDSSGTSAALLGAAALLGVVVERRRRRLRSAMAASAMILSTGAAGCTCAGGNNDTGQPPPNGDAGPDASNLPSIVTYVRGSYTSAQATSDGKIWIAGYHEGDPSTGTPDDYKGDLLVGQWNATKSSVDWVAVDGVPAVAPSDKYDPNGFRGGIVDPGDDVGQYTSMVLDGKGNPIVAFYDKTNGKLRVAVYDGAKWSAHDVDAPSKGWAGRWTSMAMVAGNPVVAYQSIEPGLNGLAKAKVRVARASSASPATTGDWTIEDAFVDDSAPCIQDVCGSGQKCLLGSLVDGIPAACTTTISGCGSTCTDACIANPKDKTPYCAKARPPLSGFVNAPGAYVSLAATASGDLGLVFYDRSRGNLRGSTGKGGKWTTTPATAPLDGYVGDVAKDKLTGDRGVGATLAIDTSGNWHVAYVDGVKEWLLYMQIPGGDFTKAMAPIVVDDGTSVDGGATKFADGLHLVGDDANLALDGSNIRIVYMDATAGALRWAKSPAGPAPKFTRGVIKQDGFAGFFPKIVGTQVVNFYRMKGTTLGDVDSGTPGDPVILGDVRVLDLP